MAPWASVVLCAGPHAAERVTRQLADDAAEENHVAIVQKPQSGALQVEKAKQPTQVPPARGPAPTTEQIAARAYEIWLASGSPQGHDQDHWLQAERELRSGKPLVH